MEASPEVRAFMLRYYKAISDGDVEAMKGFFSRQEGVLLIGTDPDEWWAGYDRIVGIWQAQFEAIGGGVSFQPGEDLQAFSEGNVGWAADRAVGTLPDGTQLPPIRIATTVHKEDGEWKIVLSHVSIGVANEENFGEDIPT